MLSTDIKRRAVSIALVYQSEALNRHVRDAMTELGAKVVYETSVLAYRPKELAGSGADVVIINLDPTSDEDLTGIDDLLVDDTRRVVFNDGEVTARLSGWDLARWARHLAAKVLGEQVGLPPPPAGSEPIPQSGLQRADLSTPVRPKSLEPTTPAGSVAETEFAADEMTRALADFSMEQASRSEEKLAQDELTSTLAGLGLGDFDFSAASVLPAAEPAPKISESKSIFEELGLGLDMHEPSAQPTRSTAAAPSPEADNPFAGLDINFDSFDEAPPARDEPQGLDALLANLPKEPKPEKPEKPERVDRANAPTLELPVPPALAAKKPASSEPAANPFAGLSLELSPLDGAAAAPSSPAPSSKPSFADRDFSSALASLSLAPLDEPADAGKSVAAPAAPATPSASPPKDRGAMDLGSLALEPIEQEVDNIFTIAAKNRAAAAAAASGDSTGAAAPPELPPELPPDLPDFGDDNPFADLDLNFDNLDQAELPKLAKDTFSEGPSEDDFLKEFAAFGSSATPSAGAIEHVVVLGASIGGPDAVREFLGAVQPNARSVFVLAQHMGADFVELMAQQLQRATKTNVLMPNSGQVARAGDVLIVPVSERLLLESSGEIRLVTPDHASPYSPSIDQVLYDIADRFGDRAMAIVFSGMAHDAIEGAKYLAGKGGRIWVQDPTTCVVSSMIDGAVEAGIVSFIGSPADLAAQFNREFK
ncbi:hypothetical protein C7S18_13870 [Ahniella affigens]|uniref:protein-glutamate methylesterase n=1 Tax=Ahniella affigens TaxID=2021234 RepID=A0A2P1PTP7_9GAMM|nr:chemotaxis protein CheB [Ahniella affigens]AVP98213.1 hypothetical protein C7S18_13870 [Ahniella affigens]